MGFGFPVDEQEMHITNDGSIQFNTTATRTLLRAADQIDEFVDSPANSSYNRT